MSHIGSTGSLFLSPRRETRRRVSAELKIEYYDFGATSPFLFQFTTMNTPRNETLLRGSHETRRSRQIDADRLMYQVHRLLFFSLQLWIIAIDWFEKRTSGATLIFFFSRPHFHQL